MGAGAGSANNTDRSRLPLLVADAARRAGNGGLEMKTLPDAALHS